MENQRHGELEIFRDEKVWQLSDATSLSSGMSAFAWTSVLCAIGVAFTAMDCYFTTRGAISREVALWGGWLLSAGFGIASVLLFRRPRGSAQCHVRVEIGGEATIRGGEANVPTDRIAEIGLVRLGRGVDGEARYELTLRCRGEVWQPITRSDMAGLPYRDSAEIAGSLADYVGVPLNLSPD